MKEGRKRSPNLLSDWKYIAFTHIYCLNRWAKAICSEITVRDPLLPTLPRAFASIRHIVQIKHSPLVLYRYAIEVIHFMLDYPFLVRV